MSEVSAEQVARVISGFYDAAFGLVEWSDALHHLAILFDGSRAWLMAPSLDHPDGHTSLDDPGFHSPEAHEVMMADRLASLSMANAPGTIVCYSEMEALEALYRRQLHAEWLKPRDVWFGLQAHLSPASGRPVFVEISHDRAQGDFSDNHKRLLALIAPHVSRAGELNALARNAVVNASEGSAAATLLVDGQLRVVSANAAASALLDRFSGHIGICGGVLCLANHTEAEKLAGAVFDVTARHSRATGGVMLIGQTDDNITGSLVASVARFASPEPFGLRARRLAAVHLRPLRGEAGGDDRLAALLGDLFKLQPSHARLACALMAGGNLRQVAVERGVTYATARTYLDQIFRQTGVSHQGALVALLHELRAIQR